MIVIYLQRIWQNMFLFISLFIFFFNLIVHVKYVLYYKKLYEENLKFPNERYIIKFSNKTFHFSSSEIFANGYKIYGSLDDIKLNGTKKCP